MFRSASYQLKQIYDLKKKPIGKGAFAEVFKGSLKANSDIKVAIKTFEKAKLESINLSSIKEEIKVLWKLDHPNIVKYYDALEDPKNIFIVTEFIPGKTLWKELSDRKSYFTEREIVHIMHQLVSAVYHCHSMDIAHRDIKPDNIIIDRQHKVTLIDFGLSKSYSHENNLRTKAGSPIFMAPEVDRQIEYSRQWDVWSLGILLYILLSAQLPFSLEQYDRILKNNEVVELPFTGEIWESTSKDAKKLVSRMIVADPNKRITIEELIDHKWLEIIRYESTLSETMTISEDALQSLTELTDMSILKHTALRCLVNFIPTRKLKDLYEEFSRLDEDNDGMLNFKELKKSLQSTNPQVKNREVQRIMKRLDYFENGKIHYTDYLVARVHQSEFIDMKLVESVFKQFDSKWDQKIDKTEVSKELSNMLKSHSPHEVEEMIREYDSKKRGYLNFSDFKVMLTNP
jgi:calcium-dependent protein kinase